MVHQRGDIVGDGLETEGTVNIGSVAVRLQFDGDDAMVGANPPSIGPHMSTAQGPVDEDQWRTAPWIS